MIRLFSKPAKPEPILFAGRKTMPSIRCTDPKFQYTNSDNTDLGKRFAQVKREMGR